MSKIENNSIYNKVLTIARKKSLIQIEDTILVVCGGDRDKAYLESHGYINVTISNLDDRIKAEDFAPYQYSFQDAESLSFKDDQFDWVIVHAGLHHCYKPHQALHEMLRVGKKGALVFEARDSLIMKVGKKLNLVPTYEFEAIIDHGFKYGGVANTFIPNHIYRWNEPEVKKMVHSLLPQFKDNKFDFYYHLRLPKGRLAFIKSPIKRMILRMAFIPLQIFCFIFPKQSNEFSFLITKGTALQDWLKMEDGIIALEKSKLPKEFRVDPSS